HRDATMSSIELRLGGGLGVPHRGAFFASERLCYHRSARASGHLIEMPNIKQQKKRVRTAAEERLQNLRYRSTAKTLANRLRDAVDGGDKAAIAEEHKKLVSWLDRAA